MATISISGPSDGETIDAADVNTPLNTIVAAINGNLDNDNLAANANISGSKIAADSIPGTALDTTSRGGWLAGVLAAPNTITNNGNRSYDLVFNSVDYTQELSPGMRLRATRTVTAPTQCADLEASSSQYFSKTTPAGITFTDDFTMGGWYKPESYVAGGIIARRNADTEGWSLGLNASGQVVAWAGRIASNNSSTVSAQSINLSKQTHIAASVDLSANSVLIYIDGVLVPSTTTVTGTITALVQGTTALVVGAEKSAGTNPIDGKLAQTFVNSTILSAATIRSLMSQTLTGAETGMVAAYTLSNSLLDLTSNDNDLTAAGSALATNVDSPFAGGANATGGYTAGTTEFAEVKSVTFSTNTTVVVQTGDGYQIPTSGGVSAVAYSTQHAPLGFPGVTGTIACRAFRNAALTVGGGEESTLLDTENFDIGSNFNTSTGIFTCPVAGYYQVSGSVAISNIDIDGQGIAVIYVNGVAYAYSGSYAPSATADPKSTVSTLVPAGVGTTIELWVDCTSTESLLPGSSFTYMSVHFIGS